MRQSTALTRGRSVDLKPVEYMIIEFPGNTFNGDIAPAIARLVDRGLVRILDLVFVKKDADGSILYFEYDDLDEITGFAEIDGEADGLLNDEDIEELAADLELESSALFIVWEDLWAGELATAIRESGGRLIAGERIPHEVVSAILSEIDDDTDSTTTHEGLTS